MKIFGILLSAATFFVFAYFTATEALASAGLYEPPPHSHWFLALMFLGACVRILVQLAKDVTA